MPKILLAALIAWATPLFAGGLVEELFIQKVADDWYAHFKLYIEGECNAGRLPEFYSRSESAELRQFRVQEVADGRLVCLQIAPTQESETVKLDWAEWKPRYMAGVYPVSGNDDTADIVAFAVWLYLNAPEQPQLGNRVLTELYEREKKLQSKIADFVREREQWKSKDPAAVAEVWDAEFQKWRRVLMPKKDAERAEKDRREEARKALERLLGEYTDRAKRTLTLRELAHDLQALRSKFSGTDTFDKRAAEVEKTLSAIDTDLKQVDVFTELADKSPAETAGSEYEKALELDPCSALLLSKAANAWCKHGKPEFLRDEWICTHESSIRKAKDLYRRWLEREPENVQVIDQLVICHEVLGESTEAQNMRNRKAKLGK